ncbi:unnamed protein product [Didymodactylos carnosus]|uniref:EH domain-containing protein n=1 Tax=Didymodactylos carnosus TaxID=1234261 RepID=A0A8S2KZ10_9BILA|nr:unnamed protein product [Didymodactylos carnosus]CAF3877720.1 unnamed protein product [Didymodactylos carnosus]
MSVDLSAGSIPVLYRDVFEILNPNDLGKITMNIFKSLFESTNLSSTILAQIWDISLPKGRTLTRTDLYKCLAFIALAQQGKPIDEKLLENYTNKELPVPIIGDINELGDRFIRLLRDNHSQTILCFRYGDLCSLDTIQVELVPEKKGNTHNFRSVIIRHFEYEVSSMLVFIASFWQDCGDNMKVQFRNTLDEFSLQTSTVQSDNKNSETDSMKLFKTSQQHIHFIHQIVVQMRLCLHNFNERNIKNAETFSSIEKQIQLLSSDPTVVDPWAMGVNEYWSIIQTGLSQLPIELNAVSERMNEQYKREDELMSDHVDMLIDLLQGYKELCKRFEEALANDQKNMQKMNNQRNRSSTTRLSLSKNTDKEESVEKTETGLNQHEIILQEMEKKNTHALKCVQLETQLVYANIESFIYILSSFGNSQLKLHSDLLQVWKAFCPKVNSIAQSYMVNQTTTTSTSNSFK